MMVTFSSCLADLDEYNPSGSTADIIFATEEGHTGLVNLCYSPLRKEFYGRENPVLMNMIGTDIWHESPSKPEYAPTGLYGSKLNSTNTGLMKNCWERFYIPINNCNAAIERGPTAEYTSETVKTVRIAEAHFLRAFYYWHIVEQWGGVVLKMDETNSVIKTAQRSSVRDFYEKCILPDLEHASANLPSYQPDHGRATRASAQGLLARTYLTWASYLKYFENNDSEADIYYRKALDAADSIITNPGNYKNGLALYDDIKDVFAFGNNKNNKEAMFIVGHSTKDELNPQNAANRLPSYFISSYANKNMGVELSAQYGYADMIFMAPTRYFLQLYDDTRDARYSAFFREAWYCNDTAAYNKNWTTASIKVFGKDTTQFQAGSEVPERLRTKLRLNVGDTAIYYTKNVVPNKATVKYAVRDINDIYNSDGTFNTPTSDNFFPQLMKYQDTVYATANSKNNAGKLDVILMRLAEMYLIAAEASFHLTKNNYDPTAFQYINALRDRSAVGGAGTFNVTNAEVDASGGGQGGYLNFILDERARELCGEHLRWFDLKRTKQLEHRLGPNSAVKANPSITEFNPSKHYVRPIPISFLQSIDNGAEFGQNLNYD
jgi:hypothetical protein